jgi:hypothetical protein
MKSIALWWTSCSEIPDGIPETIAEIRKPSSAEQEDDDCAQ